MNKLITSTEDYVTGSFKDFILDTEKSTLYFEKDSFMENLEFRVKQLESVWVLKPGATITCGCLVSLEGVTGSIKIVSSDNTKCVLQFGILADKENHFTIQNEMTGNHNYSEIRMRVVGEKNSKTILKTVGILKKDTKDNEFLEDVKYLNEEESYILCLPELIVDSNEVVANHNVTIGNITEEDLFYLESKGIFEETAKNLLRDGFVKSMMIKREEDENED